MPPYTDANMEGRMNGGSYTYSLDMIVSSFILAKLYWICRVYVHYSPWANKLSSKILHKNKMKPNVVFSFKADISSRQIFVVLLNCIVFVSILSILLRNFEVSYHNLNITSTMDFKPISNSIWLSIVTITTVGYGDGYPVSHPARIFAVIGCLFGQFLLSVGINMLFSYV